MVLLTLARVFQCGFHLWQGFSGVDGKFHWFRKFIWGDQAAQTGEEGRPENYPTSDFDTKNISLLLKRFRIISKETPLTKVDSRKRDTDTPK